MKNIVVLGSTGSVGTQTLDLVRSFPEEINIFGLGAGRNEKLLIKQINEFSPKYFSSNTDLKDHSGASFIKPEEMVISPEVDLVMCATSGIIGMDPVLAALKAGKVVALANKEVLVMAGPYLKQLTKDYGSKILPVDSEPSAIWQCIEGESTIPKRLIITASGGAFRGRKWQSLADVSPKEALLHPTWRMGAKITIDSATLMNKVFEVIESSYLFEIGFEKIDVVIHKQSIVHAMVEFLDGSVKAQLGWPNMHHPIQRALFYPDRIENPALPTFNPIEAGSLTFEPIDSASAPCFEMGLKYGTRGGAWASALAGADEAAVRLFLNGRIRFVDIPDVIDLTMGRHNEIQEPSISDLKHTADWALNDTLARYDSI